MNQEQFTWIKTRDGSPTLWDNNISEPYRSLRGAFSESWHAFAAPAIECVHHHKLIPIVGEFGLGIGTNAIIFSIACEYYKIKFKYIAIEKKPALFFDCLNFWRNNSVLFINFFKQKNIIIDEEILTVAFNNLENIKIFESPTEKLPLVNIWFHDPFGIDVNPEGYTESTLNILKKNWQRPCFGFSYACNKLFKENLKKIGVKELTIIKKKTTNSNRDYLSFKY